jgi:hypothetical protein
MEAKEFFSDKDIQLPLTRVQPDFPAYLGQVLSKFRKLLGQIKGSDPLSLRVLARARASRRLCRALMSSISSYYEGYPSSAYDNFARAVDELKPLLLQLQYEKISSMRDIRLYRMRSSAEEKLDRGGIFHVPFEKRHEVATQRFSIPGLPCLYLGGSLFTCWREFRRASLETMHVASFVLDDGETLKVVDLAHRPAWLAQWFSTHAIDAFGDGGVDFLAAHVLLWPLMAACTIRVLHHGKPFIPEYIIPQMLLQWVRSHADLDGIRWFSTHISGVVENPHWVSNYAIPVQSSESQGFCAALKKKFIITEPYLWRELSLANLVGRVSDMRDSFQVEIIDGIKEQYAFTEFGDVQWSLNWLLELIGRHRAATKEFSFGKVP